jgi:hypothetical protein
MYNSHLGLLTNVLAGAHERSVLPESQVHHRKKINWVGMGVFMGAWLKWVELGVLLGAC